jgi:hypothetical protein
MTTFDGLLARIRQQVSGYTKDQAAYAELAADMADDDVTFTVTSDTEQSISRGLLEIDDELILVKRYDASSGVVSVMAGLNGRGAEGTIPATHAANSLITTDPKYPRARMREAVNDVLTSLYPTLCVFETTVISNISVVYEYGMPADALDVWAVSDSLVGPTKVWMQGLNYRFNPTADTTAFPTGKSIQLFDAVTPGQPMLVKYTKAPQALVNGSDDFAAGSGLPERCVDLVVWGACARLLPAYEAARLQQTSVESTERAPLVPPSSATKAAQYFMAMYQQRLEEERMRMFEENPQTTSYGS